MNTSYNPQEFDLKGLFVERVTSIEKLLSDCMDCMQDAHNNINRCDWYALADNLRDVSEKAAEVQRRSIALQKNSE